MAITPFIYSFVADFVIGLPIALLIGSAGFAEGYVALKLILLVIYLFLYLIFLVRVPACSPGRVVPCAGFPLPPACSLSVINQTLGSLVA